VRSEHSHQSTVVKWARSKGLLIYRIHNGGKRTPAQVSYALAEGELPGYPDLGLDEPNHTWHGLRIEMKKPSEKSKKNGGLSPDQIKIHPMLMEKGYLVVTCYSDEEAKNVICEYKGWDYERMA